jgi:long-chain acyl-CoA synthetase
LVQLHPATFEELAAKVKDGVEGAEKAAHLILERVKKEANERLAAFSRISRVKIQAEPFEKTPTQKIKRYLYDSPAREGKK